MNLKYSKNIPKVLCAASRVYEENKGVGNYSFSSKSPSNTYNVICVFLPAKPLLIMVKRPDGSSCDNTNAWDSLSQTCLLQFINSADAQIIY